MDRSTLCCFAFVLLAALSFAPALAVAQTPARATESFPRVRLGANLGLGTGSRGVALDGSARLGVAVSRDFAVAYQLSGVETTSSFLGGSSVTWASHALLLEWTAPWPGLLLGVGPSVAVGTFHQSCGWLSSCEVSSYVDVGIDARVAVVLGSYGTRARGGFTLALALHASPEAVVGTFGIGFDVY